MNGLAPDADGCLKGLVGSTSGLAPGMKGLKGVASSTSRLAPGPEMNHILVEEDVLEHMLEVELPTEDYYVAFRQALSVKFPSAHPLVLDHLVSLTALHDVSIVTGFSFGVKKAEVLQPNLKFVR